MAAEGSVWVFGLLAIVVVAFAIGLVLGVFCVPSTKGRAGRRGRSGSAGTAGPDGETGPSGSTGDSGSGSGVTGPASDVVGPTGATGDHGAYGVPQSLLDLMIAQTSTQPDTQPYPGQTYYGQVLPANTTTGVQYSTPMMNPNAFYNANTSTYAAGQAADYQATASLLVVNTSGTPSSVVLSLLIDDVVVASSALVPIAATETALVGPVSVLAFLGQDGVANINVAATVGAGALTVIGSQGTFAVAKLPT